MTTENTTEIIVQKQIFSVEKMRQEEKARLTSIVQVAVSFDKEISTKEEYEKTHTERMKLQKCRTGIANARKSFTDPLEKAKKEAIELEKELIAITEPTEKALLAREEAYEAEQSRIKAEKEAEERRILQIRIDELNSYHAAYDISIIQKMTDDGFRMLADMMKRKYEEAVAAKRAEEEAEKKKQEEAEAALAEQRKKEDEERSAQAEAMRKQQEELDKQKEALQKEAEAVAARKKEVEDAEKKRIADEEAKKQAEEEAKRAEATKMRTEKYATFLSENGYTEESKDDYIVRNEGCKVSLYKKIAETDL